MIEEPMVDTSGEFEKWVEEEQASGLPIVILPSGAVTITQCAEHLFGLIAPTKSLFVRGGALAKTIVRDSGLLALEILRPEAARSSFEKHAQLVSWRAGSDGTPVLKPTHCPQDMAAALLASSEAIALLPRIAGLINCPILREVDAMLTVAGRGYDEATKLLITGGENPPTVGLDEAITSLLGLLDDFKFQTDGDKARAVASLITPALKMGGLLTRRVPADVAEADQSQSGKTYRQKLIAAIYNEQVSLITSREGGVGSVDESLSQQLIAGRPFIQFDNFRGRLASTHLEAFMTAEGSFPCRVPHRGEITVKPESFFVFLTSNGVDTTRDFANRSCIIRISKQPPGFEFRRFAEGDLLDHVRERQAYYLGCVFAIAREWHAQGKLRTNETRHDFREWVQVTDWICQNLFWTVPLMDGHQQAQERVSNPAMVWLRKLVLAVNEAGQTRQQLTATELVECCAGADIAIPGLREGTDADKGKRNVGSIMAKLFGDNATIDVDDFEVTRAERYLSRDNTSDGGNFKSKTYTVTKK